MFLIFDDRPSDSPFVQRIWRCHSERAGSFLSIAASHWEMVVTRLKGKTTLTVRGPVTCKLLISSAIWYSSLILNHLLLAKGDYPQVFPHKLWRFRLNESL